MDSRLNGLPWTSAQDEQLRILARNNLPTNIIAYRLGRRPEQVFARAHELGLLKREKPPTEH